MSDAMNDTPTPNIGDIVEYGLDSFDRKPERYRVSSWLRIAPPRQPTDSPTDWLDEILYDTCQKIHGHRMQYCLREEATHLSLSGIGGTIAPISECKVVGTIEGAWSQQSIDEARVYALELGLRHEMIF